MLGAEFCNVATYSQSGGSLLEVLDLSVRIERDEGVVRLLNGVSFRLGIG